MEFSLQLADSGLEVWHRLSLLLDHPNLLQPQPQGLPGLLCPPPDEDPQSPHCFFLTAFMHISVSGCCHLIRVFSFLRADSAPCSLCTSWYAQRSSSSNRSLNLMASSSCPSREARISFSSLTRGSLVSLLLGTFLTPSPTLELLWPLILCVGTSFPSLKVRDVLCAALRGEVG